MIRLILTGLLLGLLAACSSSSPSSGAAPSGSTGGSQVQLPASGTVTLSGPDTNNIPLTLDTGFAASLPASSGLPAQVMLVDSSSTVTESSGLLVPLAGNLNNFLVLIASDIVNLGTPSQLISMTLVRNGVTYDYTCTTLSSGADNCGANTISIDLTARKVVFNNAMVENDDTLQTHIINGTVSW